MSNRYLFFKYEGNWYLGCVYGGKREGISILEVIVKNEKLLLPGSINGYPVLRMENPKITQRELVRELRIPSSLEVYLLPNLSFPFLQTVSVEEGNSFYSSDGLSLYSKDGTRFISALAGSNQKEFTLPKSVQVIAAHAFSYAKIKKLHFLNPDVEVEEDAFEGMKWLDSFPDQVVKVGNLLYQVRGPISFLDCKRQGITRVHPHAFDLYKPKTIIGLYDEGIEKKEEIEENKDEYAGQEDYVEGEENLLEDPILAKISFSKDRKTLLRFPEDLEAEKLVIPPFVFHVEEGAFAGQKYLQKVGLADPVLSVGEEAFSHMSSLEYMRTLKGPKVFPDAKEGGLGVFEGCEKLSKIVLGDMVEEIGDRCFKGCPLRDIQFSPVLRRIGKEAFCDAVGSISLPETVETVGKAAFAKVSYVEAYEGSASGIMEAIFPLEGKRSFPEDIVAFTIHRKDEGAPLYLRIPLTLKEEGRRLLSGAWDEESISLGLLAKCFTFIENEKEKQSYGLLLLSQFPDQPEMKSIRAELGRVSHLIAQRYLDAGAEDELLELLNLRIINPGKVLGLINQAKARGLKGAVEALRDYGARETARKQGMQ